MRELTIEEIIEELQNSDAELQFVDVDEKTDALIHSITKVREDGSLVMEYFLYDGVLRLIIDGKMITFGEDGDYPKFWELVGAKSDKDEVENEWRVIEEKLPDFLKPHTVELAQIINSRLPH